MTEDWYRSPQPTAYGYTTTGVPTMSEIKESIHALLNQLEDAIADQNLTLQISLLKATRALIEQAELATGYHRSASPATPETPGSSETALLPQQRRHHRKRRTLKNMT